MTAYGQRQVTKSGSKAAAQLLSKRRGRVDLDSLLQEIKQLPLDTLTITSSVIFYKNGYRYVDVICSRCGEEKAVSVDNIRAGKTTACWCKPKYEDPRIHKLMERWHAMVNRCTRKTNRQWKDYGGRGIKVMFKSAEEYVEYVLKNLPHPTYAKINIDRINNDGHYAPGNLRLATHAENLRNTQRNVFVEYRGEILTATDVHSRMMKDFPGFKLDKGYTVRSLRKGVQWPELLNAKPRGPYKKTTMRKSTTS